jgi:hypothetical protein
MYLEKKGFLITHLTSVRSGCCTKQKTKELDLLLKLNTNEHDVP